MVCAVRTLELSGIIWTFRERMRDKGDDAEYSSVTNVSMFRRTQMKLAFRFEPQDWRWASGPLGSERRKSR